MRTQITLRVLWENHDRDMASIDWRPFREISTSVVEFSRDFDDPLVEALFSVLSKKRLVNGSVTMFTFDYPYTKTEIAAAKWFYARVTRGSYKLTENVRFSYDTTHECPFCGAGRVPT